MVGVMALGLSQVGRRIGEADSTTLRDCPKFATRNDMATRLRVFYQVVWDRHRKMVFGWKR